MITDPPGNWTLGDRSVNRIGFGAMRLPQNDQAFAADAVPRDRDLGRDHLDLVNLRVQGPASTSEHFGVLAGLHEAGAGGDEHDEVLATARAHGASPPQVRLAWALRRGPHVLVIPTTGTPGRLEDNVAAGALRLTPDEPARLDAVHLASPER
ncbi:aldo/keto reductase [Amycolatopsis sp. NPDC024027]|uniref:aldo/keto reductase n=1 Tax=Amycolatopsis sp. NPDC024027 TaxID=3154327 RepID=UPI0033C708D4